MSGGERFSDDAQRYLDAGPHGLLEPQEQADADRLLSLAARQAAALPSIDPALDDRVMAAVRARGATRRPARWRWLIEARVRPMWVPAAAAAAALVVWFAGRSPSRAVTGAGARTTLAATAPDTVFVHFSVAAPDAGSAALAGSFNGWSTSALPMRRSADGTWSVTVALPVGEHQYQFVLDGRRWRPDPSAHAQVDDGFGGTNSVIVVGGKGLVRS